MDSFLNNVNSTLDAHVQIERLGEHKVKFKTKSLITLVSK